MIDEIVKILEDAKDRIVSNIQGAGITASGRTEKSFRVETYSNGVRLVAGGNDTAPIATLEIGRKPGKVPLNMTEIIKQWIIDKGITIKPKPYKSEKGGKYTAEERGLMSMAGAIAWNKIPKKGTNRFTDPRNDIYSNIIAEFVPEIRKAIVTGIINMIKTN